MTVESAFKQDADGYYAELTEDEMLDFGYDWREWLRRAKTTLASSSWQVADGVTIAEGSAQVVQQGIASVVLSFAVEATSDRFYLVTNRMTTADGRVREKSFRLRKVSWRT